MFSHICPLTIIIERKMKENLMKNYEKLKIIASVGHVIVCGRLITPALNFRNDFFWSQRYEIHTAIHDLIVCSHQRIISTARY